MKIRTLVAACLLVAGCAGKEQFTLEIGVTGEGTVETTAGDVCTDDCELVFEEGATVELSNTATFGWTFERWSGACTGVDTCVIVMDRNQNLTARFGKLPTATLSLSLLGDGPGTITSAPSGISCPPTCEAEFPVNAQISLTASVDRFQGWYGACAGLEEVCEVNMINDQTVFAGVGPAATTWWSHGFGTGMEETALAVTVDSRGYSYVLGTFEDSVDVGGGTLDGVPGRMSIYLAKHAPDGTFVWGRRIGEGTMLALEMDVADDGSIVIMGAHPDTLTIGGVSDTATGSGYSAIVAKFGTLGQTEWVHYAGGAGLILAVGGGFDSNGGVLVALQTTATINLGGDDIAPPLAIGRFTSSGEHDWSRGYAGDVFGAAVSGGDLVLAGYFTGDIDLGGPNLLSSLDLSDVFVAKFSGTNGDHLWSRSMVGTGFDGTHDIPGAPTIIFVPIYASGSVSVGSDGTVFVATRFSNELDVGLVQPLEAVGGHDVAVIAFNDDGSPRYARSFGGVSDDIAIRVLGGAGSALVMGTYTGDVDFGGPVLSSIGSHAFLLRLDAQGSTDWVIDGGQLPSSVTAVPGRPFLAAGPNGNLAFFRSFQSSLSVGGANLNSMGGTDASLVRIGQ